MLAGFPEAVGELIRMSANARIEHFERMRIGGIAQYIALAVECEAGCDPE